jgi:hypothetical protein
MRRSLIVLTLSALLMWGCDDNFYLSEAEVYGYQRPLWSASVANSTFAGLRGQLFIAQFTGANPPQLANTNLLSVLEKGTLLPAFELANRQIDLARLTSEMERQIQSLVASRLSFFKGSSDEHVRIEQFNSLTIRFHNSPTFNYDPRNNTMSLSVVIRMTIQGTIKVHGVDSWLSRLLVGPIDGTYPIAITLDNFSILRSTDST